MVHEHVLECVHHSGFLVAETLVHRPHMKALRDGLTIAFRHRVLPSIGADGRKRAVGIALFKSLLGHQRGAAYQQASHEQGQSLHLLPSYEQSGRTRQLYV
jgi:hypothetical protein